MVPESRFRGVILRDVIVDVLGNLLPGTLFVGIAGAVLLWPAVSFVEIARITVPEAAGLEIAVMSAFLEFADRFELALGVWAVIVAYVLGHLFYRQDIKVPDKRSFRRIRDSVANQQWVARTEPECEFPYLNLKAYLQNRGLRHLAAMVPWTAPAQPEQGAAKADAHSPSPSERVQRTKTFINALKLRILSHAPGSFGPIARNEAHVRLNSSTWYMARTIQRLSVIALVVAAGLAWYLGGLQTRGGATQRLVWLPLAAPLAALLLATWMNRKIENVLHYQRVREVIHVLETAHLVFRDRPEVIADLCFPSSAGQHQTAAEHPVAAPDAGTDGGGAV